MIKTFGFKYKRLDYPVGEMHVVIEPKIAKKIKILWEFQKNDEMIELLFVCKTLQKMGHRVDNLMIPYMPFGRQDRSAFHGDCFSLKVASEIIEVCGALNLTTIDPHSDVTPALFRNLSVVEQHEIFAPMLKDKKDFYLVSPDGGALKKIYKLAPKVKCLDVIECSKRRDVRNGNISGVKVHIDSLRGKDAYIVDDICDGGRTFVEVAKALKGKVVGNIYLMVTHGFFTKGLQVFDGLIDGVYTLKGRVK